MVSGQKGSSCYTIFIKAAVLDVILTRLGSSGRLNVNIVKTVSLTQVHKNDNMYVHLLICQFFCMLGHFVR